MLIENVTFCLAAGTDVAQFLAADRAVQTEFIANEPGFLRRTTARGRDGEWLDAILWSSEADADASASRSVGDPAVAKLNALIDAATLRTRRYYSLD
jgi:hypothetical protein